MAKKFTFAILVGSVRHNRQGIKVARWLESVVKGRGHNVEFIDPKETPLDFLDKMYKEFEGDAPKNMEKIHNQLEKADGFFLVTPEYNHGTSGAMKNLLDHFQKEYIFKPAGIVSYSAGNFGGIRAAEQLRLIALELGMTPTPIALPISNVFETFSETGELVNESYTKRVNRFLDDFEWYAEAFTPQRLKGTPN